MLPFLYETKDIMIKWINSCDTSEQLDLLTEVMDKFVFERFASTDPFELEIVKTDLEDIWLTRKLIVAATKPIAPDSNSIEPDKNEL